MTAQGSAQGAADVREAQMGLIVALLVCKLITLAGSTGTTLWLVSFFFFEETLAPHRWTLLLGGLALVAVGEIGSWLIGRKAAKETA